MLENAHILNRISATKQLVFWVGFLFGAWIKRTLRRVKGKNGHKQHVALAAIRPASIATKETGKLHLQ